MPFEMTVSTDNWRPDWWPVGKILKRIAGLGEKYIELTTQTGFNLLEGLGFLPYVSVDDDPYIMRDVLKENKLELKSIDCGYPIWSMHSVEVLCKTIPWGDMLSGCKIYVVTDSAEYPPGRSKEEWYNVIKYHMELVLPIAERHNAIVAIEPHGWLSTQPESLLRLVTQNKSRHIGINFDTGNAYIAGTDPAKFVDLVKDHIVHMHIKDVTAALSSEMRGEETGIASSEAPVGSGVNAENIKKCFDIMEKTG
ncbi:MAG: sugar phosphate isomerase/epimerase family protein, partial [Spirochaetia bacterium]